MLAQYMIGKSKIFNDIKVFQNLLEKRSLLMMSFLLLISSKWFLTNKLHISHMSQSITSLINLMLYI